MNNEQEFLAYIAGVMDGDGSFSIMRKKPEKEGRSPLFYPIIQLANASEDLVRLVYQKFGGSFFTRKERLTEEGAFRKASHQWKIEKSPICLPFLEAVIPYLKIKKERAEFLRDFIIANPFKRGSSKLSQDIIVNRESDYIKMRQFNDKRSITDKFTTKKCVNNSKDRLFWAYGAGMIDTDGSMSIGKDHSDKHMINPKYSAYISLTMTDIKAINFLKENCIHGYVSVIKSKAAIKGFCYRWSMHSKDEIQSFLENCIEFLVVKKEQASVLINYCSNRVNTSYNRAGIPSEELKFREECHQKIKQLNKYGVYKPNLIDLEA